MIVAGTRGDLLGHASLAPDEPCVAGRPGSWTITYVAGPHGIDDGGAIRIAFRVSNDWGAPQTDDPGAPNFVTVAVSGDAKATLTFDARAHLRPWSRAVTVRVADGFLREGESIAIRLGDRSGGSIGSEAQTFVEQSLEFLVAVDIYATGRFLEVQRLHMTMVPGPWHDCEIMLPSQASPGSEIILHARFTDAWGNAASEGAQGLALVPQRAWPSLPSDIAVDVLNLGVYARSIVAPMAPGIYRTELVDPTSGRQFISNPIRVADADQLKEFWGDLHGQSGETLGTGTVHEYLQFARDSALLDFVGHQGNCFEMSDGSWSDISGALREHHEEGRFVTFVGYEWSGTTGGGGDRNVYFLGDHEPIHRAGTWALDEPTDDTGTFPVERLHDRFRGRQDVLLVPHVGGRYAELRQHDGALEPVVEVCSAHGHFDWLYLEALRDGRKVGVVGGSDDHTGRPGASHPRRGTYGVLGGLTCVYAAALTRQGIWDAIRRRNCYATSGKRIRLSISCRDAAMGETTVVRQPAVLSVRASGTAPIERIELWERHRCRQVYASGSPQRPCRLRVRWGGARRRGRGRATVWDGSLQCRQGVITRAEPYAFDSPAEGIIARSDVAVTWRSITSGDDDGVILEIDDLSRAILDFNTSLLSCTIDVSSVERTGAVTHALGGEDLHVTFELVPEPLGLDVAYEFSVEPPEECVPFWIKLVQNDGHKAWTSPIWLAPPSDQATNRDPSGVSGNE